MKIAYIYPEKLPSKKARAISVINSAYELAQLSDCTLFIDSDSIVEDISKQYRLKNHLDIQRVSKRFLGVRSNKFFNKNLLKILKKENFNVIYVRHLKAAKYLIKYKSPVQKVIFECHEIFHQTLQEEKPQEISKIKQLKELESYVYEHCDGLVCVNQTLQKHFKNVFKDNPQLKQAVIYNGMNFDKQYIKKDFSKIEDLHYIGNFFHWKGLQEAIKVIQFFNELRLNIIGGDSKERTGELKNLAKSLLLEDRISFYGFKQRDEVEKILQNEAQITLIPNIKSIQNDFSMPIKLFEYMATSNIVIAADMDTIQEIIIDEKNGFLFKSGDINSFKETLEKVLSLSNEELQKVAKNAYDTSKEFTWKNRAKKIVEFSKAL